MKRQLSASALRLILAAGLLLLIAAGTLGFVYLRGLLAAKADAITALTAEAANSASRLTALSEAKKTLAQNASVVQKVQEMTALSKDYAYQPKIITGIYGIAAKSGVGISSIVFQSPTANSTTGTTAPASTTAPAAVTNLPNGLKIVKADISVQNPVHYDQLLAFIYYIEQNTFSMQISKVTITSANKTDDPSLVTCSTFTIGVYVQ